MQPTEKHHQNKVLLTEEHIYFGGMNLSYQLFVITGERLRRFRIRIALGGETCEADVGADLARAMNFYQCIVRGGVTPCTLDDVLQDLAYA